MTMKRIIVKLGQRLDTSLDSITAAIHLFNLFIHIFDWQKIQSSSQTQPFRIPDGLVCTDFYLLFFKTCLQKFCFVLVCSKQVQGRYGWNWSVQDMKYSQAALAASHISNPEVTDFIWNWLFAGWDLVSGRATQWQARYQIEHCQQTISLIYNEVEIGPNFILVPYLQKFLFWPITDLYGII